MNEKDLFFSWKAVLSFFIVLFSPSILFPCDGFDSNGNAVMAGGTLIVHGPTTDREGPLDVNGSFLVSGGTIIAVGSSGMAETPDG